jgi:hypothetical protein
MNKDWEEGAGAELRGLEMSVTQEEPKDGFPESLGKPVAEGVRITRGNMELAPGDKGALPAISVKKGR